MRQLVAEAQGVRRPAAEAQSVRQLVAEAQGVRRPAAEAQGVRQLVAEAQGARRPAAEAQGVRQLVAEAQGARRPAAEAQGVRQLVAEAQGVRRPAAEAQALQRAAQAWQVWPAQASAYLFRAGFVRPRSPMPIPRAPVEPITPESGMTVPASNAVVIFMMASHVCRGNHDARMSHAFNRNSLQQDSSEASSGARPLEARRLSQTAS